MIRAPPQPYLGLKVFVFLAAVTLATVIGTYMFASYTNEVSRNRNYLTLGFDHIYILSKRGKENRRRVMAKQMQFQGMTFGFHPALSSYDIEHPAEYTHFLGEEHWPNVFQNHSLSAEALADYRSHLNVISDMVRLEFGSALVLSDRVDMEVEIKQQMRDIVTKVPSSWEILYLGHCSSEPETHRPSGISDTLFFAFEPRCTFAYAVSRQGAIRLKRILDNIWPNPKHPFDIQLIELVKPYFIEAYVIEPPLITERQDYSSQENLHNVKFRPLQKSTLNKLGIIP
ncbi:hypothetical protein J3B02_005267 [Coemansia erecta]|uniref:Glycosyl transferase family 25 domain-containing protein n=1 Tax=Coemansia asiatica TaxID=1052880 RepID=A0A9W7XKU2_9FUNG|nr:hypothetical protein LPJ64_001715 [Coemansia asiatica]KAJ2843431.1 hypothetical protein J3B02_005267 [Coemansia erecta]KAJ2862473.1 hypothetical protein FB639_005385 [Coemansia asiatica]